MSHFQISRPAPEDFEEQELVERPVRPAPKERLGEKKDNSICDCRDKAVCAGPKFSAPCLRIADMAPCFYYRCAIYKKALVMGMINPEKGGALSYKEFERDYVTMESAPEAIRKRLAALPSYDEWLAARK